MKRIILIMFIFVSCSSKIDYYQWTLDIVYVNGEKETKLVTGCSPLGRPYLNDSGCVRTTNDGAYPCFQLIACGVRNLNVKKTEVLYQK